FGLQVTDEASVLVEHAHVHLDDLDGRLERRLGLLLRAEREREEGDQRDGDACVHGETPNSELRTMNYELRTRVRCSQFGVHSSEFHWIAATLSEYFFFPSFSSQAICFPSGDHEGKTASLVPSNSCRLPRSSMTTSRPLLWAE